MDFDFSMTSSPFTTASIALKTVYILHADLTYDVHKGRIYSKDFVALRTVAGTGNVKIDRFEEITVYSGTLLFFKHSEIRRYYCSDEKWDFWWFEFFGSEGLNLPLNRLLRLDTIENEQEDCSVCLDLLRKDNTGSSCLASATLNLLMSKWMPYFENRKYTNPYSDAIDKTIYHMKLNMENNPSVREMANMTGLCERRFRQVFYDITGVGPKKYMEALRIATAEELLRNTPFSINEISIKLGYSSQFHFSKAFHKCHGLSPFSYRKGTKLEK